MSAKEKMIGDLLYCFDPEDPENKQVAKVSEVRNEYGNGELKFEPWNSWFEDGWFCGIHITSKFWVENGFEMRDGFWVYPIPAYGFIRAISIGMVNGIWAYAVDIAHEGDKISMTIGCVHELQHALRLLGFNQIADKLKA